MFNTEEYIIKGCLREIINTMASTFAPNGLRSNEETCAGMVVDQERWSTAEARVSELLEFIKPSQESETRRNAVISYIQHLLMSSVPCQVHLPKLSLFFIALLSTSINVRYSITIYDEFCL